MRTFSITLLLSALAAAAAANAASAPVKRPAPISLDEARAIALRVAPGKIVKQEREKENGALRYSFDILQDGRIHEIGVDVSTGKIVEDKFEDPKARD